MVAKKKYDPIGEVLSVETAFVQASHALDLAGDMAVESRDTDLLTKVAAMYIELGTRLMGPGEEESDEEELDEVPESTSQFGFAPHSHIEPTKEAAETDGRTNRYQAKAHRGRIIGIHTKHGEL